MDKYELVSMQLADYNQQLADLYQKYNTCLSVISFFWIIAILGFILSVIFVVVFLVKRDDLCKKVMKGCIITTALSGVMIVVLSFVGSRYSIQHDAILMSDEYKTLVEMDNRNSLKQELDSLGGW